MNGITLTLILVPILLSLWVCDSVAAKKGLNKRYWHIMALIFGPFVIPFVLLAKPKNIDKDV